MLTWRRFLLRENPSRVKYDFFHHRPGNIFPLYWFDDELSSKDNGCSTSWEYFVVEETGRKLGYRQISTEKVCHNQQITEEIFQWAVQLDCFWGVHDRHYRSWREKRWDLSASNISQSIIGPFTQQRRQQDRLADVCSCHEMFKSNENALESLNSGCRLGLVVNDRRDAVLLQKNQSTRIGEKVKPSSGSSRQALAVSRDNALTIY